MRTFAALISPNTPASRAWSRSQASCARGRLGALVLAEVGGDLEAAGAALDDQYRGCFSSLADSFQALTEETVDIPKALRGYIDYDAMARDAQLNGEIFTVETAHDEVHVFWVR